MASSLKRLRKICGISQSPAHTSDRLFSESQVFSEGFSRQIPWPMTEDGGEDEEAKKGTSKEEDGEQHSIIFGLQRM